MTPKGSYLFHVLTTSIIILTWRLTRPSRSNHTTTFNQEKDLNFTQLSEKYGYPSTEHTVVTQDGYILKAFRMEGRNCRTKKTPVILSHGLLQSSDVWLDAGSEAGLAFLLADACYDLWVSNVRGNYYGRRHIHLDPEDSKFWQFSVDEIGLYDVPAVIDYVINQTRVSKVNYVGFSQGAGTFYIMCSERPEYCDKINVMVSLAPGTRQFNTKSIPYRISTLIFERFYGFLSKIAYEEVFPKGTVTDSFLDFICSVPVVSTYVCSLTSYVDSGHPGSISNHTQRALYRHFPAGTSLKNMVRYGQSMSSTDFVKFDYGDAENFKVYGTKQPPVYNLSAVTVPVVVLYGRNDHLADIEDIRWLVKKLPNVVESVEIADPLWNHFDMTYSTYTSEMLFPKMSEYLAQYS